MQGGGAQVISPGQDRVSWLEMASGGETVATSDVVPTETGVLSLNTSKPPEPAEDASGGARGERRQQYKQLASLAFIMTSVVGQRYS